MTTKAARAQQRAELASLMKELLAGGLTRAEARAMAITIMGERDVIVVDNDGVRRLVTTDQPE